MTLITLKPSRGPNAAVRVRRPSERRSLSRSATRALDVLELFAEARCPLRAVDVATALAMNPSTTNQLLKTMVDSGHLVFAARGKTYLPSPRLAGFAAWMVETCGAGERLRELIRDLCARTGMMITVATPNDLFMQVIDLAAPPGWTSERGLRISLFGSATGSAHLATLDDAEVRRLAARARIAAAEVPAILEAAARIRRDGFADGPSIDGAFWSIAVPLPAQGMRVPAVLGLAGPPGRVVPARERLFAAMREATGRWLDDGRG